MFVRSLTVSQFRNLESRQLELTERVNVFTGKNGQGKTSLLEAIYLLAHPRSFRTTKSRELVSWSASSSASSSANSSERCRVEAVLSTESGERTIGFEIAGGTRTTFLNGKRIDSLSAFYGQLTVVVFTPDELQLVKGAPQLRRAFLDRTLAMVDKSFVESAVQYQRALRHRNAFLTGGATSPTEIAVWDDLLIEYGTLVAERRRRFVELLNEKFPSYYAAVLTESGEQEVIERVTLRYESDFLDADGARPKEALLGELAARIDRDRRQRSTTFGVHRDDLVLALDTGYGKKSARAVSSQGQARCMALALKFCAVDFLREQTGEEPVLLLDDVESELDPERKRALYRLLKGFRSQVFLSTTEVFSYLNNISDSIGYFQISGGRIDPLPSPNFNG